MYCSFFSTNFIHLQMGAVDPMAFDKMIEAAAEAPRRFGLAPKTSDLFSSPAVSKIGCYRTTVREVVF
jgi:hypothetical protein